jgi:hypothetical protein
MSEGKKDALKMTVPSSEKIPDFQPERINNSSKGIEKRVSASNG